MCGSEHAEPVKHKGKERGGGGEGSEPQIMKGPVHLAKNLDHYYRHWGATDGLRREIA